MRNEMLNYDEVAKARFAAYYCIAYTIPNTISRAFDINYATGEQFIFTVVVVVVVFVKYSYCSALVFFLLLLLFHFL